MASRIYQSIFTLFFLLVPIHPGFADDLKDLDGVWNPVTAELGMQRFPEEQLKTMRLKIKDGTYEVTVANVSDRGTLKIDSRANPATMDIIGTEGPNKGKTIPAIYELRGNSLRICYSLSGEKRPMEFKTGGTESIFLVTYKRVK